MYTNTKQKGSHRAPNYSSRNKASSDRASNHSSRNNTSSGSRGGFSSGKSSYSSRNNKSSYSSRGNSRNKKKSNYERIDFSKFINKSTVIEKEEKYLPQNTFGDFKVEEKLKVAIARKQYIYPTPIQDKAIPYALLGKDILGIADTGTGKTAAFLIPIINKMVKDHSETAIIIAPTRELAIQIEKEFTELAYGMKIYAAICVGGTPITPQIRNIRRGCNAIIGTPGRLLDLVKRGEIKLANTRSVVLDEADRMLDMGFIDDITYLLKQTSDDRQTFFFSATLPKPIEKLIEEFGKTPVRIMVKTRDTSKNVEQDIVRVSRDANKIDVLCDLLQKEEEFKKVLIFSEMKHSVEKLSVELIKRGFKAGSIHGDKRHNDRQRTLTNFKQGTLNILVATDVAARGLDIPSVSHVINYEIPQTYDTYIHRVGRTGRASHKGVALTFV